MLNSSLLGEKNELSEKFNNMSFRTGKKIDELHLESVGVAIGKCLAKNLIIKIES